MPEGSINSLTEEREKHVEAIKGKPDKRKLIKKWVYAEIERVVKPGVIDGCVGKGAFLAGWCLSISGRGGESESRESESQVHKDSMPLEYAGGRELVSAGEKLPAGHSAGCFT